MICTRLVARSRQGFIRFENTSVIDECFASSSDGKEGVIFRVLITESETGILEFRCEESFKRGTELADDLHADHNDAV